jgi:hypothetical protein
LHFIPPGELWRNGYVESLNSRNRDKCLNANSAELSGSLSDGDAAKVLDAVFVGQIVDDFGEFSSHLRRRRVPRGRLLTIVELDGDEVVAHGQPPDGARMAQRYRETVKSAL